MRLEDHLEDSYLAEGKMDNILKKLWRMPLKQAEKLMRDSWKKMTSVIKKQGKEEEILHLINKYFTTGFRNLDDVARQKIKESKDERVNEDLAHFWDLAKVELFPAFSFYPALQVWMNIDKIIQGEPASFKVIAAYSLWFLFLISGKHIAQWAKWKKDNPKEFEKEGGRLNPFASRR